MPPELPAKHRLAVGQKLRELTWITALHSCLMDAVTAPGRRPAGRSTVQRPGSRTAEKPTTTRHCRQRQSHARLH